VTSLTLEGFGIDTPPGFRTEEVTIGLRMGLPGGGPQPSLMVQSKAARQGASLETLVSETMTELAQTVANIKGLTSGAITFADGGTGAVLAYTFPTHVGEMRQYFVMRLAGERLCNVTLTVPQASLTDANASTFMKAITSLKVV
jgi:hypothetical protein